MIKQFSSNKGVIFLFSILHFGFYVNANADCDSSSPSVVAQLDHVYYASSNLRIFYTKSGENALQFPVDKNKNKVPDYIENIAIQANSIRQAWTLLGYQDPLKSPRYKERVQYIDIQIQQLNGLGLAFDEPHRHVNNPLKQNACALVILISNNIPNLTGNSSVVAHELFHLYTYGYTMFKQPWLTESLAAWSEGIIRKGKIGAYGQRKLPENEEDFNQYILQRTYKTSQLWNRLTILIDTSNGELHLPSPLLEMKYTDGQSVFQDPYLKGTHFIKKFLENLSKQDQQIAHLNNWDLYHWKEGDQKSEKFNQQVLNTLFITLEKINKHNAEKSKFKKLLKNVIKN
ncbi:peptidase MA family protein [Acinetobacter venetianus]|uniref:peptidase MA family protein n=1 Tax=Acinetobacter venetianus TaxID=52133 RepID=UPI0021500E22|nr:peptidase MA family protein [Acinetobacter venetianus]MCR4532673.1 peptidase MA family protein [Acinetobacter venetianus]